MQNISAKMVAVMKECAHVLKTGPTIFMATNMLPHPMC